MDSSEEEDMVMLGFILIDEEKKRKKRRFWVREIFKQREKQGVFSNLLTELRLHDREFYFRLVHVM